MYERNLKIGILLDDYQNDKWVEEMLDNIEALGIADISLVVKNAHKPSLGGSILHKIRRHKLQIITILARYFLSKIFNFLYDRGFVKNNAFDIVDLKSRFSDVPEIIVNPIQTKFTDTLPEQSIEEIQTHNIDLFIRLGFRILKGEILTLAPLGIWSYHHGDHRVNRGGPNGFWEYVEKWPETGSILQILTDSLDGGKVLYQSTSCTLSSGLQQNKNNNFWKSQLFISRKLKELYQLGEDEFLAKVEEENAFPDFYSKRIYVKPTNIQLTFIVLKGLPLKIINKIRNYLYFEQWIILIKKSSQMAVNMGSFQRLLPPKDRFWADPFIIEEEGKYYLFIEESPYNTNKGHLSVMTLKDDNIWSEPTTILEKSYHLSYPNVFKIKNEYFMIPESGANKTVDLYRCTEFPYKWEYCKTLIDNISAYDATIVEHNGLWWMSCSVVEHDNMSSCDELHLFYSDKFDSTNWHAHQANPVVSNVSLARPAGNFIKKQGRLYRAAQNCSNRYGYGFSFTEVLGLSVNSYKEQVITTVEPCWKKDVLSTHTYNYTKNISVSDAKIRRPRYW
jgi:hypothetical protein